MTDDLVDVLVAGAKRKASSLEPANDREISTDEEDDESMECSICSEDWTDRGPHRLVALQCGHLFGLRCITKWMDHGQANKQPCPACKSNIKESAIREVKPIRLAVQDTAHIEEMRAQIDILEKQLKDNDFELRKTLMAISMCNRELLHHGVPAAGTASSSDHNASPQHQDKSREFSPSDTLPSLSSLATPPKNFYHFRSELMPTDTLMTRALALDAHTGSALVSRKQQNQHGVHRVLLERGTGTFIPLHKGVIRDIQCREDAMLTCGHDRTLKLSSLKTGKAVCSMDLPSPGFSCAFDPDVSSQVYCGLANGVCLVYDVRHASSPLYQLRDPAKVKPIHSMIPLAVNDRRLLLYATSSGLNGWTMDMPTMTTDPPSVTMNTASMTMDDDRDEGGGSEHKTEESDAVAPSLHDFPLKDLDGYFDDFEPYSLSKDQDSTTVLFSLKRHNATKHVVATVADDLRLCSTQIVSQPYHPTWSHHTLHFCIDGKDMLWYADVEHKNLCLRVAGASNEVQFPIGERVYNVKHRLLASDQHVVACLTPSKLHLYRYGS